MRNFMIEKRVRTGLTMEDMARRCECTRYLLDGLETGDIKVTHPNIAARIAKAYSLTVEEYEKLIPQNYRNGRIPKAKPKIKSFGRCNLEMALPPVRF